MILCELFCQLLDQAVERFWVILCKSCKRLAIKSNILLLELVDELRVGEPELMDSCIDAERPETAEDAYKRKHYKVFNEAPLTSLPKLDEHIITEMGFRKNSPGFKADS